MLKHMGIWDKTRLIVRSHITAARQSKRAFFDPTPDPSILEELYYVGKALENRREGNTHGAVTIEHTVDDTYLYLPFEISGQTGRILYRMIEQQKGVKLRNFYSGCSWDLDPRFGLYQQDNKDRSFIRLKVEEGTPDLALLEKELLEPLEAMKETRHIKSYKEEAITGRKLSRYIYGFENTRQAEQVEKLFCTILVAGTSVPGMIADVDRKAKDTKEVKYPFPHVIITDAREDKFSLIPSIIGGFPQTVIDGTCPLEAELLNLNKIPDSLEATPDDHAKLSGLRKELLPPGPDTPSTQTTEVRLHRPGRIKAPRKRHPKSEPSTVPDEQGQSSPGASR